LRSDIAKLPSNIRILIIDINGLPRVAGNHPNGSKSPLEDDGRSSSARRYNDVVYGGWLGENELVVIIEIPIRVDWGCANLRAGYGDSQTKMNDRRRWSLVEREVNSEIGEQEGDLPLDVVGGGIERRSEKLLKT